MGSFPSVVPVLIALVASATVRCAAFTTAQRVAGSKQVRAGVALAARMGQRALASLVAHVRCTRGAQHAIPRPNGRFAGGSVRVA